MSDLILENIVGFKAVDKNGNEQNVTVDEMVDMVSTRMVMALSETSTFAAAAATGNDVYENELPTVTDAANVRVLQSSGDAAKMTMQSLASKLGELMKNLGLLSFVKSGFYSGDLNELKGLDAEYSLDNKCTNGPKDYFMDYAHISVRRHNDQTWQFIYNSDQIAMKRNYYYSQSGYVWGNWETVSLT